MECLMVSRAFKKMINTLDHGSTKAKKVKTIGTYVERKGEQKDMELTIGIPVTTRVSEAGNPKLAGSHDSLEVPGYHL